LASTLPSTNSSTIFDTPCVIAVTHHGQSTSTAKLL